MADSGGGAIGFGVNDDGTPSAADLTAIVSIDPAVIGDKIKKYTAQHFGGMLDFEERLARRTARRPYRGLGIDADCLHGAGTSDVGGGRQKTAFSAGTVYFRHGVKSEPGTSEDLRAVLERALERIRSSWLDGITKLVTARLDSASAVAGEVTLSGSAEAARIRLVNDETASAHCSAGESGGRHARQHAALVR
jgi:hypothetical protein